MPKVVERGFFSAEIKLSDVKAGMPASVEPRVQILRVGSFQHPKYGEFDITTAILAEMKRNFDAHIRGIDIALDYFHESDKKASGWLRDLTLSEDGEELWGDVDWTLNARKMLSERELRYFSPDFAFEWTDPESGKTYNNVLFGGGLTNRPFVKDMAAIVASEERENEMTLAELEKKILKLAEDIGDLPAKHAELQKAHADLLAKHGALQKKLDDSAPASDEVDDDSDEPADLEAAKKQLGEMKKKLAEYDEKAKQAEQAKQMAEKKSKFQLMLTEGKACAAQEKAFLEGDMENFVKLAEKPNLSGSGHGGGTSESGNKSGDRDDQVLKLAEEKMKADTKLSKIDAITLANREVK